MGQPNVIWCGPDEPPKSTKRRSVIRLNTLSDYHNVNLRISNISRKLVRELPPLLLDLLEVASYVYAGDQCVGRGGTTLPGDGADWRRELRYRIPVRQVKVWQRSEVIQALTQVLSFVSDDFYDFEFVELTNQGSSEPYFEFDEGQPWFHADEVMLFSGGLDSLAGLCEAVRTRQGNLILVSHRSAPQTDSVQRKLLVDFKEATGSEKRLLHVPVWVNKREQLTKDTHQRTRSFLYASLGATLACMHDIDSLQFYENGITSSNLSLAPSVLGARASRTTHPKALAGYGKLFSLLFGKPITVDNPFFWKTKADIIRVILSHQLNGLIRYATSCSHVRSGDPISNHCGVCSQCVGRRLAILYNRAEKDDPEEMYKLRLPLDPMPKDIERAMIEVIIKAGRDMEQIDAIEFFMQHAELSDIVTALGMKADEAANRVLDLHRRHGRQVCEVLERIVEENSSIIARGQLPEDSLLSMIVEPAGGQARAEIAKPLRLPDGTTWEDVAVEIVGLDAAKITVGTEVCAASFQEMGFLNRTTKNPNRLWQLLVDFAEANGALTYNTKERTHEWTKKDVQRLRRSLEAYFGLTGDPFRPYTTEDGYRTRFKICYDRSAKPLSEISPDN